MSLQTLPKFDMLEIHEITGCSTCLLRLRREAVRDSWEPRFIGANR